MAISASQVKELRDKTNAGMMECKKALTETDGDIDAAIKLLREKGIAKAGKKADRAANEGLVAAKIDSAGRSGVLFEINCETDFVAKNDNFKALVAEVGEILISASVSTLEEALALPAHGGSLDEYLKTKVLELGENLVLSRVDRLSVAEGSEGAIASYIHLGGKVGVLLQLAVGNADTTGADAFGELIKDLTLHIAASAPQGLTRDEISGDVIEGEKEIFRKQLLDQGKPEQIIDKIIEGKIGKFYSESVLLEQGFVKDPDTNIAALLENVGKGLGDTVSISAFKRYSIGA